MRHFEVTDRDINTSKNIITCLHLSAAANKYTKHFFTPLHIKDAVFYVIPQSIYCTQLTKNLIVNRILTRL